MTKRPNRSIPSADVIPVLRVADVPGAARWLVEVLGFRERLRIADHRVQLEHGDGALVVAEARQPIEQPSASIMLRVANLDDLVARAVERGAAMIHAPEDYPYGERQATLHAPFGHVFTLSQTIADSDPGDWGGELLP